MCGFTLIPLLFRDRPSQLIGGCLLGLFKGGAGGNYHLRDKSLPTTPQQVAAIPFTLHLHNILDRREVVLGKCKDCMVIVSPGKGFDTFMSQRKWLMMGKKVSLCNQ